MVAIQYKIHNIAVGVVVATASDAAAYDEA